MMNNGHIRDRWAGEGGSPRDRGASFLRGWRKGEGDNATVWTDTRYSPLNTLVSFVKESGLQKGKNYIPRPCYIIQCDILKDLDLEILVAVNEDERFGRFGVLEGLGFWKVWGCLWMVLWSALWSCVNVFSTWIYCHFDPQSILLDLSMTRSGSEMRSSSYYQMKVKASRSIQGRQVQQPQDVIYCSTIECT